MLRLIFALLVVVGLPAQDLKLQVLATTDTHGRLMPQDTYSLQPGACGWALIAPLIRERKAANPNTLLVDCGDTLQGEPTDYVQARLHPELPQPAIAVMNDLGAAAMAVGNHDYDFGIGALRASEKAARFPFLSANTVFAKDGKAAFPPYTRVDLAGVRVAILGLTTAALPRLAGPDAMKGLKVLDAVECAREWVPRLREKEKADLVVVAMHGGLGDSPGRPGDENEGLRLLEQVPGVDLLLLGHTHRAVQSSHRGVPILQAESQGRALAVAELTLVAAQGRWKLTGARTELLRPSLATPPDPQVLALTAPIRLEAGRYLDTLATNLQTDLDGRWCRIEDTPLMALLHRVTRDAVEAQLSAASVPPPRLFIPKGATSIRQFWSLAPYENTVGRIRITGAQLRAYLEHAADAFGQSHQPELFNPAVPFYDVDTVSGCTYALDLSRPKGLRVVNLRYQGHPVTPDQSFTLALTSYRLSGGGGYLQAMGFQGAPEAVSAQTLRNLLFQYLLARPALSLSAEDNWRTIPYIDRERLLAPAS